MTPTTAGPAHWRRGYDAYARGECRVIRERVVMPDGRVIDRSREVWLATRLALGRPYREPARFILAPWPVSTQSGLPGFESPMFIRAFCGFDVLESFDLIRACRCSHAMSALSDIRKRHICFGPKRTFGICQYPFK